MIRRVMVWIRKVAAESRRLHIALTTEMVPDTILLLSGQRISGCNAVEFHEAM